MTPPHKANGRRDRDNSSEPGQAGFFARHEWTLVGLLAVLAFVLGCIGYSQTMTFSNVGGPNTWWDVAYGSLRLFIFEAPEESAGWPLYMQVARALAPMVVLYTAAKAVWNVVEELSIAGGDFNARGPLSLRLQPEAGDDINLRPLGGAGRCA